MRGKAAATKIKVTEGAEQFRTLNLLTGPVKINEMIIDAFTRRGAGGRQKEAEKLMNSTYTYLKQSTLTKYVSSSKDMEKKNIHGNSLKKNIKPAPKKSVLVNSPKKNMPSSPKKNRPSSPKISEKKSIHESSPKKNIPSSPKNAEKKRIHENNPKQNMLSSPKNIKKESVHEKRPSKKRKISFNKEQITQLKNGPVVALTRSEKLQNSRDTPDFMVKRNRLHHQLDILTNYKTEKHSSPQHKYFNAAKSSPKKNLSVSFNLLEMRDGSTRIKSSVARFKVDDENLAKRLEYLKKDHQRLIQMKRRGSLKKTSI